MKGIVKSMIVRELIENKEIVGYDFRKKMSNLGIKVSNGSIYLHLKNFEEKGILDSYIKGKRKIYFLTEDGNKELTKKIKNIPSNIEKLMQNAGSQIPFIDWNDANDIEKFLNTLNTLVKLVEEHKEECK